MLDPEPTLEYILESQWPSRLQKLGFKPIGFISFRLYFQHKQWSITASGHDSGDTVLFIVADATCTTHSYTQSTCPPERAYDYARFLIKTIALVRASVVKAHERP